jgi:hypothetical protein
MESMKYVSVPSWMSKPASWQSSDKCRWSAPATCIGLAPLKEIYSSKLQDSNAELGKLEAFFCNTLGVSNMNDEDAIQELVFLKGMTQGDFTMETVQNLYKFLERKPESSSMIR